MQTIRACSWLPSLSRPSRARIAIIALALALPAWARLFSEEPSEPRPRQGHVLVADDRARLHLIGGNDGARIIWDHWIYDTGSESWERLDLPPQIEALNAMEAAFADGLVVIVGSVPETISAGRGKASPSSSSSPNPDLLNTVFAFDVAAEAWTAYHPVGAPPKRQGYSLAALPDGNFLLFGGRYLGRSGWIDLDDSWILDPRRGAWTRLAASPSPPARRSALMGPIAGGLILLAGGSAGEEGRLEDCWEYNPFEETWYWNQDACVPAFTIASGAPLRDGSFLMQRQIVDAEFFGDLWLFDPVESSWEPVDGTEGIDARLSPLAAIGDTVWLFSGSRDEDLYFGLEAFEIDER